MRKMKSAYIRNKKVVKIIFIVLIISFSILSCIEEFYPSLNTSEELLVIDAAIIRGEEIQHIYISKSTPINELDINPISECTVYIEDTQGNQFFFNENDPGDYSANIPQQQLALNRSFRLNVITPENKEYQSEYETIFESSPIDSLYYSVEYYQSSSEEFDQGLQFYADLKAEEGATKNYLWTVEETWEILTEYKIYGSYVRESYIFPVWNPISDSINVCWSTKSISDIFSSSTQNLSINEKKKIPLNFVGNTSKKLNTRYSILVKQYSLSDAAFIYWEQNKISTVESGGLYQTQPSQSKSNIHNVNDANEVVLGFFWVSSYTEKRIFFDGPLSFYNSDCSIFECWPSDCNLFIHLESLQKDVSYLVPALMHPDIQDSVLVWGFPKDQLCIDCTTEGGTTEKPDFW